MTSKCVWSNEHYQVFIKTAFQIRVHCYYGHYCTIHNQRMLSNYFRSWPMRVRLETYAWFAQLSYCEVRQEFASSLKCCDLVFNDYPVARQLKSFSLHGDQPGIYCFVFPGLFIVRTLPYAKALRHLDSTFYMLCKNKACRKGNKTIPSIQAELYNEDIF